MDEWKLIEDAEPPHDTPVLLGWWYHGLWRMEATSFSTGWRRNGVSTISTHGQATHWMTLPEPPSELG